MSTSARRTGAVLLVAVLAHFTTSPLPGQTVRPEPLSGGDAVARAYDAILDARFDELPAVLAATCGPAPREVCDLLEAVTLWWRIQLDPADRRFDQALEERADEAVLAAEAWTRREPDRAEAWFYLGAAFGLRVRWHVLRDERLAAARDGKRSMDALERALDLEPGLADAHFGRGLYRYYADVVPAAAKVLRWLLLLPGGDRDAGLQEMLEARERGRVLRSEAAFELQQIYLWYENRPNDALTVLEGLRARYPRNHRFAQLVAQVHDEYLHDPSSSLRTWQRLLNAARRGEVAEPRSAEVLAHLGAARQLEALAETDLALLHLEEVTAAAPARPVGSHAEAWLQMGRAFDRMGRRDDASTAYAAAAAAIPEDDPTDVGRRLARARRSRPDVAAGEAHRLALEGWRALERGQLDDAERRIRESLGIAPDEPVARYRYAQLLLRTQRLDAAFDVLEPLVGRVDLSPVFQARASLDVGRLWESRGDVEHALERYDIAAKKDGADPMTRAAARNEHTRLTLEIASRVR
ncbi:MAG: tetratricopeptide repeat protein [Vicinamibacterales bacterium]